MADAWSNRPVYNRRLSLFQFRQMINHNSYEYGRREYHRTHEDKRGACTCGVGGGCTGDWFLSSGFPLSYPHAPNRGIELLSDGPHRSRNQRCLVPQDAEEARRERLASPCGLRPDAQRPKLHRASIRTECHRSEEHTSELQSHSDLVCRLLLEKKKNKKINTQTYIYNK